MDHLIDQLREHYVRYAIAGYLFVGLLLTRVILRAPSHRMRIRDYLIGSVAMPILFVALLTCVVSEDLMRKILIALDFDPPENMRAGPRPVDLESRDS